MTSTGRIFCAFLAQEQVSAMARSQMTSLSHPGASDRQATGESTVNQQWRRRLDEIRERGIERGVDFPSPGISSLSVPVLDAANRMQLALTVIGSSGSIDVAWDGAVARKLRETAQSVTNALANPT
jgi:DNA-binding IclR family transcriptional regulator